MSEIIKKRILVAGFQHETNTFAPTKASYESFSSGGGKPGLPRGEALLSLRDVNIPIGGSIIACENEGWEVLPVVWASANPSAHVTTEAYERIAGEIVDAAACGGFHAIYLDLHGAMVSENFDDGEGEILERIRRVVGPAIPIVVSLDLHANVTDKMLNNATGLVAFRTYPHVDMAETGARAVKLLKTVFESEPPLFRANRRLPFLIPINGMCTLLDPARSFFEYLARFENNSICSVSFAPGFPAADFPECGPVIWAYGTDEDAVSAAVAQLYERMLEEEHLWQVKFYEPDQAVYEAMRLSDLDEADGPVVIADTQDNPGAGADSNTAGMIQALVSANARSAAVGLVFDPEVAARAHAVGIGGVLQATLGGRSGVAEDEPFTGEFEVTFLSDGRCRYDGPVMHGMEVNLGPVACLRIGEVLVAVSSKKAQMLDRNLFRMAGIEPENMKILVNKSSVHFRADFEPIAFRVLVAKAPGPMKGDPADLPWQNLKDGIRICPKGPAFRRH